MIRNGYQQPPGVAEDVDVNDQGSVTDAAVEATNAPVVVESAPAKPDYEALVAKLTAKQDQLEKDNRAYREQLRGFKTNDEEAKKQKGEFEPLLKERDETIARLQSEHERALAAAARWEEHEAKIAKLIEDDAASLDEDDRKIVASVSDLDARATLVRKLKAAQVKPAEAKPEGIGPAGRTLPNANGAGAPKAFSPFR